MTDLGLKAVLSNDLLLMRFSVLPSSLMSYVLISKENSFLYTYQFLEEKQDSLFLDRHVACNALFEGPSTYDVLRLKAIIKKISDPVHTYCKFSNLIKISPKMFLGNPFQLIDKKLARLKDYSKPGNVVEANVAGVSRFCPKLVKNAKIVLENVLVTEKTF